MAYVNSVMVTYFLRSNDFALYLQCNFYGSVTLAYIFKAVYPILVERGAMVQNNAGYHGLQ